MSVTLWKSEWTWQDRHLNAQDYFSWYCWDLETTGNRNLHLVLMELEFFWFKSLDKSWPKHCEWNRLVKYLQVKSRKNKKAKRFFEQHNHRHLCSISAKRCFLYSLIFVSSTRASFGKIQERSMSISVLTIPEKIYVNSIPYLEFCSYLSSAPLHVASERCNGIKTLIRDISRYVAILMSGGLWIELAMFSINFVFQM